MLTILKCQTFRRCWFLGSSSSASERLAVRSALFGRSKCVAAVDRHGWRGMTREGRERRGEVDEDLGDGEV